jgi:hypothetical protein
MVEIGVHLQIKFTCLLRSQHSQKRLHQMVQLRPRQLQVLPHALQPLQPRQQVASLLPHADGQELALAPLLCAQMQGVKYLADPVLPGFRSGYSLEHESAVLVAHQQEHVDGGEQGFVDRGEGSR